jgi:D-ribose pyranose/furanose isomerase RbsD
MKRSPTDEKSTIFNKYYQIKWMKDIGFVKKWCCEDEEIRTTNPVEAWHSRINKYVGRKNPNLAQILEVLERETKLRNFKPAMKVNKKYREIDEEIKIAIAELCNNEITVGHCLEIIAPFMY